jgi:molecular chaperone DnaK (HSP70)
MRQLLSWFPLAIAAATAYAGPQVVEAPTPAIGISGSLLEHVGIEIMGGTFTPLLKRGCTLPCSTTQTFSTAEDGQVEIKLALLRGNTKLAKDATALGRYAVVGIRALPRGEPSISITFTASAEGISIEAVDKLANKPLAIVRREP